MLVRLELDPEDPKAHHNLADVLDTLGYSDQARPHWQAYLRHDSAGSLWAEHAQGQCAIWLRKHGLPGDELLAVSRVIRTAVFSTRAVRPNGVQVGVRGRIPHSVTPSLQSHQRERPREVGHWL